jgi:ribose/xylose/arabinose/galactoside ABC-type transport system permease subunit
VTAPPGADERLAHRGPVQRLLIRPEIGALVGALAVWAFFWITGDAFATTGGTANYLDVAAITGIMAIPVAMLMIGGEFDLSSGAMTGASGMGVVLLSKEIGEFGGAGLHLHLAVPLMFLLAMAVGWFNGTLVDKTGLPSFIVTLGTFFVLIGAKLGFAKVFTDKVIVEGLDQSDGYGFWDAVFGSQWTRNEHVWNGRDDWWAAGLIVGGVLLVLGVMEQAFRRRATPVAPALLASVAGLVLAIVGLWRLLRTDGVGNNVVWGVALAAGLLLLFLGWAYGRFEPAGGQAAPTGSLAPQVARYVGAGVGAIVIAIILGAVMDSTDQGRLDFVGGAAGRWIFFLGVALTGILAVVIAFSRVSGGVALIGVAVAAVPAISYLMTVQAARAILFTGFAFGGLWLLLTAARRAAAASRSAGILHGVLTTAAVVLLAFFVRSEGSGRQVRVELFTAILLAGGAYLLTQLTLFLCARRNQPDALADRQGRLMVSTGALAITAGMACKLLFATDAELAASNAVIVFRVSVAWFLALAIVGTWIMSRTQFGNWVFAVGGNKDAARSIGVPVARTKTALFMLVSGCAWVTGLLLAFRLNSVQANVGDGQEFFFIIAAVVGGNLLTGGYGSVVGAAIGSLIMAMTTQGIGFAGWNTDWRFLVVGVILLLAVMVNNYVRRQAEKSR